MHELVKRLELQCLPLGFQRQPLQILRLQPSHFIHYGFAVAGVKLRPRVAWLITCKTAFP